MDQGKGETGTMRPSEAAPVDYRRGTMGGVRGQLAHGQRPPPEYEPPGPSEADGGADPPPPVPAPPSPDGSRSRSGSTGAAGCWCARSGPVPKGRGGEGEARIELLCDLPMPCELLAVVGGAGVDPIPNRPHATQDRRGDRGGRLALDPLQEEELRAPVHRRHQRTPVPGTDDRFPLPVPDPALLLNHCRPLRKVHPIGNVTASGRAAAAPVRLLALTSPVPVPGPSGLPTRPYVRVDPLCPRHHLARPPNRAGDLLRAPACRQPFLRDRPARGRPLPGHRRRLLAPGRRLAVGLLVPVASQATVARGLMCDRPGIPSQIAGHLQPSMQPGGNLASFGRGQGMGAYGHDHPPLVINRDGSPSSGPPQAACPLASQRLTGCCTSHWKRGYKLTCQYE